MCVAMVGKIVKIDGTMALCNVNGIFKKISVALLPMAGVGDDITIHAGFASELVKNKKNLFRDIISTDSLSRHILDTIKTKSAELHNESLVFYYFSPVQHSCIQKYSLNELLPLKISLQYEPSFFNATSKYINQSIHNIDAILWDKEHSINNEINILCIPTGHEPLEIFKAILEILNKKRENNE
jgi:hydrogenase maturation factor